MSLEEGEQIVQCHGNILVRLWLSVCVKWPWDPGIFTFLPFSLSREVPSQDAEMQIRVYQAAYTPVIVSKHCGYIGTCCEKEEQNEKKSAGATMHYALLKKGHLHKCLNTSLVLEVLVLFAFFKILATKCDARQGTDSFWSKLGCMRLPAKATEGWEKNHDSGSNFFTKSFFFGGGEEIILRSGANVYGKLIANVIKEERHRVLQTEAATLWTAGNIDFRLQQCLNTTYLLFFFALTSPPSLMLSNSKNCLLISVRQESTNTYVR